MAECVPLQDTKLAKDDRQNSTDGVAEMKHDVTLDLYQYWSRLRGDRPAPERREIEPSDIRDVLGHTFILQAGDAHTYPFRLAGTRMCSAYCREFKDQDFLRLWSGKDRDSMETLLAAITKDGAAAVIGFEGRNENDRFLALEMLLLPLRQDGDGFNRVLGSWAAIDQPYWLGTQPIMSQKISSVRLIWPDENPFRFRPQKIAEPENNVIPHPGIHSGSRRYGHLTILDGGRR